LSVTCPTNTVDNNAARVVAGITAALALLSLWPPATWLIAVAAADFFVRAWVNRRYSPLRWIAKQITSALQLQAKPVYAPLKQFAARIGSILAIAATVLHAGGLHLAAASVTFALLAAASLEALAGFCLACWLYPFVFRTRRA
jgi:hypothetical protein